VRYVFLEPYLAMILASSDLRRGDKEGGFGRDFGVRRPLPAGPLRSAGTVVEAVTTVLDIGGVVGRRGAGGGEGWGEAVD
jgi:hypothetical protein